MNQSSMHILGEWNFFKIIIQSIKLLRQIHFLFIIMILWVISFLYFDFSFFLEGWGLKNVYV